MQNLNKINIYKSKIIKVENGNVYKALSKNNVFYKGFGEIYFSAIEYKKIKAWKLHKKMKMSLLVPFGLVKFVFTDIKKQKFKEVLIGSEKKNYKIISVPNNIWFGFQGCAKPYSLVCNISNIIHNSKETLNMGLDKIPYEW